MIYIPLLIVILINFSITFFLLNRYSNFVQQNVFITFIVFISWFFSFNVIFILPLDITSTIYNQCIILNKDLNNNLTKFNQSTITHITRAANISSLNDSSHFNLTDHYNDSSLIIDNNLLNINNNSQNSSIKNICAKPITYVPENVLENLWKFLYWSSQLLTWIILPIMQSYSISGEFTVWKKIESSLKDNLKYYCCFGFLFLVFLFYYVSKHRLTFESLKIFCISLSNTYGLFLLLILLGYGLIDIPRNFLKNYYNNHQYKLNYLYFRIGKVSEEKYESNCNLDDLLDELRSFYCKIHSLKQQQRQQQYQKLMDKLKCIIDKCPETFRDELLSIESASTTITTADLNTELNERRLVQLNSKLKKALQTTRRTEIQYKILIQQAIHLEEIIKELNNKNGISRLSTDNYTSIERWLLKYVPKFDYLLKRKYLIIYKLFFLVSGYLFATFSIIIIWSEFTFSVKSLPISIFALIIKLISHNYLWVQIFSMLSIAYISCCCYYTIFKIRIFNYYYLAKHHQTDEYSLIFSGMLLCRLASPLCLNFLSLIHFDSHISDESIITETSFTKIMGHLDTISYINDNIFIYLPLFMCIYCIAILFKLDKKFISFFGFGYGYNLFDEISQEYLIDGEKHVQRELRKRNSTMISASKRRLDRNFNLNRTTSQEKLLSEQTVSINDDENEYEQQQQQQNVLNINKNLFDDI